MANTEQRRATRIIVDIPIVIEPIGQPALKLHPDLAAIYERVRASDQRIGDRLIGSVRDLSTNGAFIAADPLPLLSRVAISFALEGQNIDAIGWTLWRRTSDCEISREGGASVLLPQGFGVLFEAIPFDARLAIHRMVSHAVQVSR